MTTTGLSRGVGAGPAVGGRRVLMLGLATTGFACWPFSRLVHVFSMPLGYLTRPYIAYRSRDTHRPRRGWERVG